VNNLKVAHAGCHNEKFVLGMIKIGEADLLKCCGSTRWAREMAAHSFPNPKEVLATADSVWWSLTPADWLEAFRAHPRIGDRTESKWSEEEQYAARHGSHDTMVELREANRLYEERFGFIFIVCATGKSADQILRMLRDRMENDPETELRNASEQQRQIMHLRLKKLLTR
jgi:OHCU decarboxylase